MASSSYLSKSWHWPLRSKQKRSTRAQQQNRPVMTRTQSVTGGKAGQPEHCRPEHIVHSNGSFLRATKKRVQTLTHAHESRARQHQPANTARLSVAGMPRGQRRGVAVAFWLHPLPRAALVRSQLCAGRRQTRHACEASGAATPMRVLVGSNDDRQNTEMFKPQAGR